MPCASAVLNHVIVTSIPSIWPVGGVAEPDREIESIFKSSVINGE